MSQRLTPQLELDAVARSIDVIGEPEHVALRQSLRRGFAAPAEEVWAALTRADRLGQWFGRVDGTLEPGGAYAIDGDAAGTVLECTTLRRLALTWESGGSASDVVVEVDAGEERTDVRLLHAADIPREQWARYGAGAGGVGWDLALLSLRRHLEEGATQPLESTPWIGSEEARSFLADSARRWGDVSIEAGCEVGEARAAAERTRAFYLGETEG